MEREGHHTKELSVQLEFEPKERELAARAVVDYALSSLRTHPGNWPGESMTRLTSDPEVSREDLERYLSHLQFARDLALKFNAPDIGPTSVACTGEEIEFLGFALFGLGNRTVDEAEVWINARHDREDERIIIQQKREQAFNLFQKIQPILKANDRESMHWE